MIINNSTYTKDKNYNREYLKKKKSNQAFYIKAKLNSQLGEQLKNLQSRKSQARVSTSLIQMNPKEDSKRIGSLQMNSSELCNLENIGQSKASINKQKKNIGQCWSERNVNLINDATKLQKYRKFSSHVDEEQPPIQSHRRKLSLVEYPNQQQNIKKIDRLSLTAWIVLIRKLFVDQYRKRNNKSIKLNILFSYIQKLENQGLQGFSIIIQPLEYEIDFSKAQIANVLQNYFTSKKSKAVKPENSGKITFFQVLTCLIQYQSKNSNISRQNFPKSTYEEEEAVETARFQEGVDDSKRRKLSQKHQLNNLMPKMQTHKYMKETGKENAVASVNLGENQLFKSPSTCNKSKQSLNPSQSPIVINEIKSIENSEVLIQRQQSGSLVFKRGSFQMDRPHEQSLGILTISGKSPRQLMVSQIYESIQRSGFLQQNNVSFSLQNLNLEVQSHISFEHTVHSFEQILKKIKNIQRNYINKAQIQIEDTKYERNQQQVNLFLQQLINYRIAASNQPFGQEQNYSYLVSFENLTEFKDHNKGIMQALLQSSYLKQYFNALQGIKIKNSLQFLKNVAPLFHQGIRIINISHNNLSNINFLLENLTTQNSIEFLNINHNYFPEISSVLKKCNRLKELHCQSNLIGEVKGEQHMPDLKIIDLSLNKIDEQENLIGLSNIQNLIILNIFGNPITKRCWKNDWKGLINLSNIYQMQNLYVMSSFGHQKDIAFSLQKNIIKTEKDRYKNSDFIHEFSISESNKFMNSLDKETKGIKNTNRVESQLNSSKSSKQDPPKQKISKIKAFIDGKVI